MHHHIKEKEIEYMRGKKAGHPVTDNEGEYIVERGDLITDKVIEEARASDQLHYLMLAAVSTVVGEGGEAVEERLKEFGEVTLQHEIDYLRGKVVNCDVTDWEGNLLARAGDTLTDDYIECARRANAVQKLVLAVGAAGIEQAA